MPGAEEQRLEEQADACYRDGDLEGAIAAWERLHAHRRDSGDPAGAASAACMVALHLLIDTGLMAAVRGWLRRAERLLADAPGPQPAEAVVAMVGTYERFLSGDAVASERQAGVAVALGEKYGVLPAVVIGRTALGRLRILAGDVDDGLALLDEVAALLMSGDVDPLTTGMMYCELVCAAQGLGLTERAREWTDVMERWGRDAAFGGLHGRCRVHRAELLRTSGPAEAAEEEALLACAELGRGCAASTAGRWWSWARSVCGAATWPAPRRPSWRPTGTCWSPQPGLALLRLAQGHVGIALDLVTEAIERPEDNPSKEQPPFGDLRLAPLLAAQVEIATAAGAAEVARAASVRLDEIASRFPGTALLASACTARARAELLAGELEAAAASATSAVEAWGDLGAPYEAAEARLVLGAAHVRAGARSGAQLEWQAALAGFESFGAELRSAETRSLLGDGQLPSSAPGPTQAVFELVGDFRRVRYGSAEAVVPDLKGFRYLARLLADPGRERHVLDLVGSEAGSAETVGAVQAGLPVLDEEARSSYRRRLAEVEEDLAEARAMNDLGRVELAERDRDYLLAELAAATGLGGRTRTTGSTVERARTSVTRSLRYAIARLSEHLPDVGRHLSGAVRTGTWCRYEPDPLAPVSWRLGDEDQAESVTSSS